MEIPAFSIPCAKCPLRRTGELKPEVLEAFVNESLLVSMAHYDLISPIISTEEQMRYELTHIQVKMLLAILRNAQL